MTSTAKATSKTKTSAPAKTGRQTSVAPAAKAPETELAPQQKVEVASGCKFESTDALEHFIQHNPEFGTLPLEVQDKLRGQLIDIKRSEETHNRD